LAHVPSHARESGPRPLVIFGAGTLARLARAYFARDTDYQVTACTVHREHIASAQMNGLPTVPFEEIAQRYPPEEHSLFVAVGYTRVNSRRAEIFEQCLALGYDLATVVSSRSHCWDDLRIGRNCMVFDGVVIEPNVEIGDDVVVWSGAQISHDTSVGDHCFLGPNAVLLGDVTVEPRSFVGGNATVRNGVTIAADCVVGAGTVIKRDTVSGEVYAVERTRALEGRHSEELVDL
jgi:sugar O-acyltransferase (sialic acid O-acetyltransferase NeuD family)